MDFKPENGHLLVKLDTIDSEKKSAILVPVTNEARVMQDFEAVRVIDTASDCKKSYPYDLKLVVEGNLLRQITIAGEALYLIHEKYVLLREKD